MKKISINIIYLSVILILSYLFFFHNIGNYSLKEPDEGRYAEIPREMIELHDYAVPHLNYVRYFEKPPLFYWIVAFSYKAFGISEWSFRFPNALSALLCVIILYLFVRRWFNEEVAFISSIVLMSSFGFFSMARIVTLDMFFTLWLFLSLLLFYGYYREKIPFLLYSFYASLALATLAKGPVAVLLVGITILIFLFTEKKISFLKEFKWITGILIYGVITIPWLLVISLKEKDFFYFFFIDQHLLRFLTSKHKRTGSVFYFFPVLFGGMFPWSIFIPRGIVSLWRKNELRLLIIWTLVVFAFFSISKSKLPPYILPVFPPLSIIIGYMFHKKWEEVIERKREVIISIFIFFILSTSVFLCMSSTFNEWIGNISKDAVDILRDLRAFSIYISLVSIISGCLLCFKRFDKFSFVFSIFTVFSSLVVFMLMLNVNIIDRLNTTKRLSNVINYHKGGIDYLINYGSFEETLPFYTKKRVILASYKGELEMGSKYEDTKDLFMNEEDFINLFASDKKVFCVLKEKKIKRLKERLSERINIVICQNERCLIYNH
ncbi:MAG: glycosyltransferase family 39 protein [Proteobacteria bacterium]|nr:glycosyltransferase family 39 protein [Pseudomonadota bacterium]